MKRSTDLRELNTRRHIYMTDPVSTAQGPLQKRGQKDYESQRIRESAVKQSPLEMPVKTRLEQWQDQWTGHVNMEGGRQSHRVLPLDRELQAAND
ncbi:hypothetical protein I79_007021 [Cricetulus griseus]|uniref:Uncharacterized protein n=1 Tax=Cricetulus griseus TaxID=10029 RepID=G3H9F3_CRIGR|nr:hypothetical protein I79_007021 [Cricetulus griseus]